MSNVAIESLRELGGYADAASLCSKMTCPHCGAGMKDSEAQLLIQRTCDTGAIQIAHDFTLYLPEQPA